MPICKIRINGSMKSVQEESGTSASRSSASSPKKTDLPLRTRLSSEARELKITISHAAEATTAKAISEKRARIWQKENKKAIEGANVYVENTDCHWKNTGCSK